MKLFWEKPAEPVKPIELVEPKYEKGSFLFATEPNDLWIISVERVMDYTEVTYRDLEGQFGGHIHNQRYYITLTQHEDFVSKLSQEIKCIIVPTNI